MDLDAFIKSLATWPLQMQTGATIGLYKESNVILRDFEAKSPVDTGEYRSGWRMAKGYQGKIAVRLYNKDVEKAEYMEFGAGIKDAPWYFPKQKKRPSGKLYIRNGRVWAGGKNPGSPITMGGSIDPILFKNNRRQLKLTKVIADSIIERLK